MQNRYSDNNIDQKNILHSFTVNWPFQRVCVQAKVVSVRTQNIFKWAVIRILEDFQEDRPSLEEAAEQLCIKDAVFLKEAAEELIAEGSVEKADSEKGTDFSNLRIISYDSMQSGNCEPELHGFFLLFDAVTGEYVPFTDDDAESNADNPVIPPEELPDMRTHVSLEKARNYARTQNEPFLTDQSGITDVKVNTDMSSVIWRPVRADIVLDQQGAVNCMLDSASEAQQSWIDKLSFEHRIFKNILNCGIDERFYPPVKSAMSFRKWNDSCRCIVEPEMLMKKAAELISSAETRIIIDAYWLNFASVRQATSGAIENKVAVTICARDCQLTDIPEQLLNAADIVQLQDYPRILLVADGEEAVSIDRVEMNISPKRNRNINVLSRLKQEHVLELTQKLSEQKKTISA